LPSAGGVHNERRWPGASSFLPDKFSIKSVINRKAEKPVLSGKIGMTPFATSDNNEYTVQEIVMNLIVFKGITIFFTQTARLKLKLQSAKISLSEAENLY
jgi:hypothetical protein